jgi:hypothetical protein
MKIIEQLQSLKSQLIKLVESNGELIESIKGKVQKLVEASSDFGHNWVGAWASKNFNYYRNFKSNGGGTLQLTEEIIQSYIEEKTGIKLEEINKAIPDLMKANREFRDEIVTELSIIKGNDVFVSENELLDKIENQEWGISHHDYIRMKTPRTVYTHDPAQLLNKGLDTPPHINIDGELMSIFTMIASVEDFQKNSKRLIRQLELKFSGTNDEEIEIPSETNFVYRLIEQFHVVVNQLRNRHDGRNTIQITDEYDIQDLLQGLLKIEYEDVRAEEYTPSYAGSSTKVDFLLKNEKIVIEVKKTREGLKDKQVGDQLILDSRHYKAHPDCKHLICFVYDPEGRIENPRGLENDLNNISDEDLVVEVFIRP